MTHRSFILTIFRMKLLTFFAFLIALAPLTFAAGNKVTFDDQGVIQVNGRPFFPIGIWVYQINDAVMHECNERRFNTIVGNGFGPDAMDRIHAQGMMAIPFSTKEFLEKSIAHPATLLWYLTDEPEGHNMDPAALKKEYDRVKAIDATHPIGIDMYLLAAIAKYKDGNDYTMTDVYPVTKNRDVPLKNVGIHMDEARRVHGANWPHLSFIQTFGGEQTDGGKWAQPTPAEVRCMTFIALVHRANGILYFSYWPQAPETWQSIGQLNRDLYQIVPYLIAPGGKEIPAKSFDGDVEIRARKVGESVLIMAVNTQRKWLRDITLSVDSLGDKPLHMAYQNREVKPSGGKWLESFAPMEEKVYIVGSEPAVSAAK
jgi:hypothetical protein